MTNISTDLLERKLTSGLETDESADYFETLHGKHNEDLENHRGYSQAASGLCYLNQTQKRMLTAELKFWKKYKNSHPELWETTLMRLRQTRGTIFVDRLIGKSNKWKLYLTKE